MIPTEEQAKQLWEKYQLPEGKRKHVGLVAKVAEFLATKCQSSNVKCQINMPLLKAGALLHDIDKNVPSLPGEEHPDTEVRILKEEGMAEVAALVKTHPLRAILDPLMSPKTREEKLLFLADKMVKYEIITVDERFKLWNDEHLPADAQSLLDRAYPKVKALEKEVFLLIGIEPSRVAQLV
ncbi:HD domain-containing protein [Candidatus Gottesmanbacteria bacterium]|nr:HD domain-containing protein [Candidatus Gottesmanbacteria bacterium]